jgi:hypothetical protein
MRHENVEQAVSSSLSMVICAGGRALDFATTWVALDRGSAIEAKPLAADVFFLLGQHTGMIVYEVLITTPMVFLGCLMARRLFRDRSTGAGSAAQLVFFVTGVISLAVAMHNTRFLY